MDPEAYFAGLELPGRQLLVFAPRGTGESSVPPAPGGYVMAGYADDVEALREHLGQHKLTLYLDRLCAAPVNWAAATSSRHRPLPEVEAPAEFRAAVTAFPAGSAASG